MKCTFVLLLVLTGILRAEVYQYAVPAKDVAGKDITAYLWVPPRTEHVRGVLVGGATGAELSMARDPQIRATCADEDLAIVMFSPPLDLFFTYRETAAAELLKAALSDLADASGIEELATAPLFPFGHAASTAFASRLVCRLPERCFGALLHKGTIDTNYDPRYAGVPILAIKGQYEEFGPGPSGVLRDNEDRETSWKTVRDSLLALRAQDPQHLVSLLVEPGATQASWSDGYAPLVARFIRRCAEQRIPDTKRGPKRVVKCTVIEAGDSNPKTFWHPDAELGRAIESYKSDQASKRPQFVAFADPDNGAPIAVSHDMRVRVKTIWEGPDTFRVLGTFLDKPPKKYPAMPAPASHAEGAIQFRVVAGAVEQTGPDTFRVTLDGREELDAQILAFHPGNETYRYTEQPGRVRLPSRLTTGKPQRITFPAVEPIKAGTPPVKLLATSDSGLPVRYYVESGPAIVKGDLLQLAELPFRVTYPVRVVVVAYQYGSAVAPLVQTAAPVRQVITVEK